MVLTRAFACAVPVVASDIPGYRAVMTEEPACSFRRATTTRSPTRSSRCSRTSRAARRSATSARRVARSGTRGTRSPSGSSRSTRSVGRVKAVAAPPAVAVDAWRGIVLAFLGGVGALLWWHGPDWASSGTRSRSVEWEWVAAAIGLNLLSVVARAFAWQTVINAAMPPPHPRFRSSSPRSAVGLLANAVLPGRVGELARVAVLDRRMPSGRASGRRSSGPSSPTACSTSCRRCCSSSGCSPRRRSRDWAHEPDPARGRRRAVPVAFATARHHRPDPARRDGRGAADRDDGAARPRRHAQPAPGAGSRLSSASAGCSSSRGLDGDAGVRHPLPLPAAGLVLVLMNVATISRSGPGTSASSRRRSRRRSRLRRRVRARDRVRLRAPGDRGVGRHRDRPDLPRARGPLVREAARDARRRRGRRAETGERRPTWRMSVSPRALACPASLKGCLSAAGAAERLAVGFRRAGVECVQLPVADGGEGTLDVLAPSSRCPDRRCVRAAAPARAGVLGGPRRSSRRRRSRSTRRVSTCRVEPRGLGAVDPRGTRPPRWSSGSAGRRRRRGRTPSGDRPAAGADTGALRRGASRSFVATSQSTRVDPGSRSITSSIPAPASIVAVPPTVTTNGVSVYCAIHSPSPRELAAITSRRDGSSGIASAASTTRTSPSTPARATRGLPKASTVSISSNSEQRTSAVPSPPSATGN